MKFVRLLLVVMLFGSVLIIGAQEETPEVTEEVVITEVVPTATPTAEPIPQFDKDTQDYVNSSLLQNLWTIVGLLVALIAGWLFARANGSDQPTRTQIVAGALTFASILDYLERLDITDENADLYIHQLSMAIKDEAKRMGTTPELILVKEAKKE